MSGFSTTVQLIYVAAASCFVLGLHLMNNPATARRGNQVSTAGMVAAVAATLALIVHSGAISVTGWIVMTAGADVGRGVPGSITVTTLLDVIIGAVTFSGSIIAAGKLQGLITSAPVSFPGSRVVNLLLAAITLAV